MTEPVSMAISLTSVTFIVVLNQWTDMCQSLSVDTARELHAVLVNLVMDSSLDEADQRNLLNYLIMRDAALKSVGETQHLSSSPPAGLLRQNLSSSWLRSA